VGYGKVDYQYNVGRIGRYRRRRICAGREGREASEKGIGREARK
jgi:hypothetical protein